MASFSSKKFNNFVIIGILIFISAINLPTLIKKRLAEHEASTEQQDVESVLSLLPDQTEFQRIIFPDFTLSHTTEWLSDMPLSIAPKTLVERWLALEGTEVNAALLAQLGIYEMVPKTVMFQSKQGEPFVIAYYEFPRFWLFKNYQNQWVAVSVAPEYLFPQVN